jgi:NAD(P)-dependent dehydrogenase (short-subunit alcohol dehydrogenase family)
MLLEGKTAIVTGAGTGLGMGTAEVFAREGANVLLVGRRLFKLEEVAERIRGQGGSALSVAGDVSVYDDVKNIVRTAIDRFGGVDVVVNNAAKHPKWNYTHRVSPEHFDESFAVNTKGPFMMMRESIPSMLERSGGSIINVSSVLGLRGMKYATAYCATKAAMVNLTRAVALEYREFGIRVNCLCVGGIDRSYVDERHYTPEEWVFLANATRPALPTEGPYLQADEAPPRGVLRGGVNPYELAQTLLYLAGPHSAHITGAVISADQGAAAG